MSITDVEAHVAVCVARGEWADFRGRPDADRVVSGDFVRRLMTGAPLSISDHQAIANREPGYEAFRPSGDVAAVPVSAAGVRIRSAIVNGIIDLSSSVHDGGGPLPALALEECWLLGRTDTAQKDLQDDRTMASLDLSRSAISSLSLKGSEFTHVSMFGGRVDGPVDMSSVKPLANWKDSAGDEVMREFRKAMGAAAKRLQDDPASNPFADDSVLKAVVDDVRPADPPFLHPDQYCWIDLSGSHVHGSIVVRHARLCVPRRDRQAQLDVQRSARFALRLEATTVDGLVDARRSVFDGGLSLYLAEIRDEVWLGGSQLVKEGGIALDAQGARIGSIFAIAAPALRVRGTVFLNNARISGHVDLPGACINGDGNSSVMAGSVTIGGDFALNGGAVIRGPVVLSASSIGGSLDLRGALLSGTTLRDRESGCTHESCNALHARNLSVGGDALLGDGLIANGCLWLSGAKCGDNLDFRGAKLAGTLPNPYQGGQAVRDPHSSADRSTVSALTASDVQVGGSLRLGSNLRTDGKFLAHGTVTIQRASVGKDLDIAGVRIVLSPAAPPDASALDLGWASIAGTLIFKGNQFDGVVNLEHATTNVLSDQDEEEGERAYGKAHLRLNGFRYETFHEPSAGATQGRPGDLVKSRTEWLGKLPRYRPQPYAQLAQVLIRHGRADEARDILVAKFREERRQRRERLSWDLWRKNKWEFIRTTTLVVTSWLFGQTFGHGLKPARAIRTLVVAFAAGWVFFWVANDRGMMVVDQQPIAGYVQNDRMVALMAEEEAASGVRCQEGFSPALYALDVFIPLVDLRQESKCEIGMANDASPPFALVAAGVTLLDEVEIDQYLKTLYALLGWLLISLAILTFSGVLQRRDAEE